MLFRQMVFVLLSVLYIPGVIAQASEFKEGEDYTVVGNFASATKKVEEFFSYNCPHCYTFDPVLEGFLENKPEDIQFNRVPVSFGRPDWEKSSEVYILADLLGVTGQLHKKAFNKAQSKNTFKSDADVKAFFLNNGVTEQKFNKASGSFFAKTVAKRNQNKIKKHKISSVPTVIVNNIYQVKITRNLDSKRFDALVKYLSNKEIAG